jgi:hypothetical protein
VELEVTIATLEERDTDFVVVECADCVMVNGTVLFLGLFKVSGVTGSPGKPAFR